MFVFIGGWGRNPMYGYIFCLIYKRRDPFSLYVHPKISNLCSSYPQTQNSVEERFSLGVNPDPNSEVHGWAGQTRRGRLCGAQHVFQNIFSNIFFSNCSILFLNCFKKKMFNLFCRIFLFVFCFNLLFLIFAVIFFLIMFNFFCIWLYFIPCYIFFLIFTIVFLNFAMIFFLNFITKFSDLCHNIFLLSLHFFWIFLYFFSDFPILFSEYIFLRQMFLFCRTAGSGPPETHQVLWFGWFLLLEVLFWSSSEERSLRKDLRGSNSSCC